MNMPVLNDTMRKFGAPQTVIHAFQYWSVMLRPAQATLGALVLVAHEPARAFSQLGTASFVELHDAVNKIEDTLARAFQYDRINYLMLMMVDPDVHFHVIPRYAQPKQFADAQFIDAGWPAAPNLGHVNETGEQTNQLIIEHIKTCWV
ncbi:Diadenosine tetraphosphate (Ap4A) hydrolase [Nitrosomonas sp. Nm51]|uniref:HIT family protein n=1 Tax=Nitrosomonas sp. Nm51 TaxID=133720 RepID=UPI0008AEEB03|nr:HIT family protein [Nitrosomonas sp. Nm51]SEQ79117.1 Diadenosine tetraphosphate (Ap4A) hydrolase [Nitrosomonas sp. Nm51]